MENTTFQKQILPSGSRFETRSISDKPIEGLVSGVDHNLGSGKHRSMLAITVFSQNAGIQGFPRYHDTSLAFSVPDLWSTPSFRGIDSESRCVLAKLQHSIWYEPFLGLRGCPVVWGMWNSRVEPRKRAKGTWVRILENTCCNEIDSATATSGKHEFEPFARMVANCLLQKSDCAVRTRTVEIEVRELFCSQPNAKCHSALIVAKLLWAWKWLPNCNTKGKHLKINTSKEMSIWG